MGASQSNEAANVSPARPTKDASDDTPQKEGKLGSKVLDTPIFMDDVRPDTGDDGFPVPTGKEYELMDQLAAELPNIIDDQSRQQVEDFRQACDDGKGPMVACFATAEYLSLFERKHKEAAQLYHNACFRPKTDKSPNGVMVDGTKAYPPACYNLAQMLMTGKGVQFDRLKGYQYFDRACQGGHGGACHMQAKMLCSEPGALGKGIPYNPKKAADLLQTVCDNGDPISCFTLATMLLRGDYVSADATNVTPQEARGEVKVQKRENEKDRAKSQDDKRISLPRDPPRAEQLLLNACNTSGHAPSCYNLAVMYNQGDDGVPKDEEKAKKYLTKVEEMVSKFGGFGM